MDALYVVTGQVITNLSHYYSKHSDLAIFVILKIKKRKVVEGSNFVFGLFTPMSRFIELFEKISKLEVPLFPFLAFFQKWIDLCSRN